MAQKATPKKTSASRKAVPAKKAVKAAAPAKRPAPSKSAATRPATKKSAPKAPAHAPARTPTHAAAPAHAHAHAPARPIAHPAAAPAVKAPPKPAASKPVHHPVAPSGSMLAPAPAPIPAAPGPLVQAAAAALVAEETAPARKPSRSASKHVVAQAPIAVPPPTSRFADRFAPPRPPSRQMNNLDLDVPRHAQKSDPKLANAWKTKTGRDLTEAEVLAMPESEYMNEKQLEFFRVKLQQLKDDLLSNAGETTEHLREDTSIVPDPADRATIEEEHALELRTRDRERKLLKKISQSLARIDSGDYGFCDETGEPIGLGRLIARPTATLSLEAQQRRELKQKMFGD
jgi:DnaK suppressor protein